MAIISDSRSSKASVEYFGTSPFAPVLPSGTHSAVDKYSTYHRHMSSTSILPPSLDGMASNSWPCSLEDRDMRSAFNAALNLFRLSGLLSAPTASKTLPKPNKFIKNEPNSSVVIVFRSGSACAECSMLRSTAESCESTKSG